MGLKIVPTPLSCTGVLQSWHRPRTQGIRPEPTDELVVRKPKALGRSSVKSTLYRAYAGPLPDPAVLSVGAQLRSHQPQPGICKILHGLYELTLVDSKFGPVPREFRTNPVNVQVSLKRIQGGSQRILCGRKSDSPA
ncbi:hypothetical protein F2P79_007344 [Pimephales promelas]|nr:hypothetical protein F2P79_007344 [Pimephales promelas]